MSDEVDVNLIVEILDAAGRVKTYIETAGRDDFMRQAQVYDAVCLNLLRVGECARFLTSETKSRLPNIPWPDIVNLRNRVAHNYEKLRPDVLWLIASVNLPELDRALRALKSALPD